MLIKYTLNHSPTALRLFAFGTRRSGDSSGGGRIVVAAVAVVMVTLTWHRQRRGITMFSFCN